jgi:hypothetical protein
MFIFVTVYQLHGATFLTLAGVAIQKNRELPRNFNSVLENNNAASFCALICVGRCAYTSYNFASAMIKMPSAFPETRKTIRVAISYQHCGPNIVVNFL